MATLPTVPLILLLVLAASPVRAEETASRTGIEIGCLIVEGRPTKQDCAGRFTIGTASPTWTEQFRLSLNDPIESFSYAGEYRPGAGFWFLRPPVLGGVRDRFVTQDPFGSTLLFTTVIGGIGLDVEFGILRFGTSSSFIYLKQRFAPTLIHSEEEQDPEAERTFGFAQGAALTAGAVTIAPVADVTLTLSGSSVDLRHGGYELMDREALASFRWVFVRWRGVAFGVAVERYRRWQSLRHDGENTSFGLGRSGLFVEM